GEIHGEGIATYPNGDEYRGNFIRGRQHGFGIMAYSNGTVYEGCWEEGQRAGASGDQGECDTATQ
ncbi:MAG: hypothetical protein AAFR52_07940, partial [Pseudomonadota bacterium]